MTETAALSVQDVRLTYGGVAALDGVSFDVPPARITGLIGPNGAGKTTLFNVASGLARAQAGSVRLFGADVTGLPPHRLAGLGLVRSFQLARGLPAFTVFEHLMLYAPRQPGEHLTAALLGRGRAHEAGIAERALATARRLGLAPVVDHRVGALSGGQRKLLEIGRALMARPRLMLLDEPAAGVNPTLAETIGDHLLAIAAQGTTILLVEHDMALVARTCAQIVVMSLGRTLATGTFDAVRDDRAVQDAYLGARGQAPSSSPLLGAPGWGGPRAPSRAATTPMATPATDPRTGLQATALTGGYGTMDDTVRSIDLDAPPGQLTCIIGPNGAGKSTALKLLAGLLRPRAGRIALDGQDLTNRSPQHIQSAGLVFVPQERNVFAALSIEDNLRLGAHASPQATTAGLALAYARFPLLHARRRHQAGALSGGQRQLLAMAAALMARPAALLLDEPTAGLSPIAAAELLHTIVALAHEDGLAILMVEQNAIEALAVSDHAVIMVDGRVARSGPAAAIAADPDISRLFLGGRTLSPTPTSREGVPA